MDTSRVDGVKAPQHRGTPRSHFRIIVNFDCRQVRHVVAPLASSYLKFLQALRRVPQQIPDGLVVDLEDRNRNDVLNGVSSPFFRLDEEVVEGP